MTGFKGTPGPWVQSCDCDWSVDTDSSNMYTHIGPEGGEPVAIVIVTSAFDMDGLLDANAALITAAPVLLKALQDLVELLPKIVSVVTVQETAAKAAIQLALGTPASEGEE